MINDKPVMDGSGLPDGTEVKSSTLFYSDGDRSDKVYYLRIVKVKNGSYRVDFAYGRRGRPLKEGVKKEGMSLSGAENLYDDLIKQKTKKGYVGTVSGIAYMGTPEQVEKAKAADAAPGDGSRWDEI